MGSNLHLLVTRMGDSNTGQARRLKGMNKEDLKVGRSRAGSAVVKLECRLCMGVAADGLPISASCSTDS